MAPALLLSSPMRATFPQALSFALLGASLVACSAEVDDDDDEVSETSEAELKNAPAGALQIYNMNTHHMSEPGKPSFEATDWRQMLAYMKEQPYLPDIVLLSEVGRNNSVPSQPCVTFVRQLEKTLSKKNKKGESKIEWTCEQASGHVTKLDNSGGGTAVVYRKNLVPRERAMVQWTTQEDGQCIPDPTGPGLSFDAGVQGRQPRRGRAPHLVSPGAGTSNTTDCSDKSLRDVTDAMARSGGREIIGGDMNHADAHRHDGRGGRRHTSSGRPPTRTPSATSAGSQAERRLQGPMVQDCPRRAVSGERRDVVLEGADAVHLGVHRQDDERRPHRLADRGGEPRENVSIPSPTRTSLRPPDGRHDAVEGVLGPPRPADARRLLTHARPRRAC